MYVEDVIQANLKALRANESGVYNVGCGGAFTFNQVVSELNAALGTNLPPDYFENPYSFTQDWTEADVNQTRKALGYEPKYDLKRGVGAYLESGKLGVAI